MADVKPVPDNYPTLCPYLYIDGAGDAIDFYVKILGATERMRMPAPDGKVGHAELNVGNSVVMLADEFPDMGAKAPTTIGGTAVGLHVYVEDVDGVYEAAISAGATSAQAPEDKFYGDRSASFVDPWGHQWHIATHVEDVPPDEMEKRAAAAMQGG